MDGHWKQTFGFATEEYQVTAERLGVYLPVEHIDNPKCVLAYEERTGTNQSAGDTVKRKEILDSSILGFVPPSIPRSLKSTLGQA